MATAADRSLPPYPQLRIETNRGAFVLELDTPRAPITVANFLTYVDDGSYVGTIFHRVIPGFVVQGGGYTPDFEQRPARGMIPNESGNGLRNERGTVAMARLRPPHSATRQFYINLRDNDTLDPRSGRWGYAVFGRVIDGLDVLDGIAGVPTGPGGPLSSDVPQAPVIIESISLLGGADGQ
jgi:peptidyl-prolyl cis-trans isomerase B (cyclophilin B)